MGFDVCLLSQPARAHSRRPPLALMMLASYLEKNGIKTEIIDIKSKSFTPVESREEREIIGKIAGRVRKSKPLVVGLSSYCTEVDETLNLTKILKQKFKKIKIVVGGVQSTLYPKDFLFKNSPIDFAIIGEGEETFTELVSKIKKGEDPKSVLGLAFFKGRKLVRNGYRPLIENLDIIPFPAYDKVDMEYYLKPHVYAIRWLLLSGFYIFTTRGCPSMCSFCVSKNLWKASGCQKTVRFRSAKKIADEVEFLVKNYKIDSFYIYDDNFVINRKRIKEFCGELKKRNIKIIWGCCARVDMVSEEMIKTMREAGCIQLDFGVESGSIDCLNRVNKNITIEQIENAFKICRKYNVRTFANLMVNFPEESEEDVRKTMELTKRIKPTITSFGILTPYPGTDIYNNLNLNLPREEYELFKDAVWSTTDNRFVLAKHNLDLNKLVTNANIQFNSPLNNLNKSIMWEYVKRIIWSKRKTQYALAIYDFLIFLITSRVPRMLSGNLSPHNRAFRRFLGRK